jgi:hypothetical protein
MAIPTSNGNIAVSLLLVAALSAGAPPAHADDRVFTLRCELTNTPPRNGGNVPERPFTQHFHVNLDIGTIDGRKAVVTSDRIGWEPRQPWFRPYATLTRPQWQYHSSRQTGRVPYSIDAPCTLESSGW